MIRFGSSRVSPKGIRTEILLALQIADRLFEHFNSDCVITSLTDGVHTATTLHKIGLAVDLRSRNLEEVDKTLLLVQLKMHLPPYYEVYLEDQGGPNEHFHIEYDYKGA